MKNDDNLLDGCISEIPFKRENYLDEIYEEMHGNPPSEEDIKLGKNKPYRVIIKGIVKTDDRS